ncbi:uncharacterized protein LOC117646216 [Thrips palmi]|uniref:Uncharacterized protein LOC117646216 n=1 Tax=Thrips palmi TaxID=161013 RepID=A0A6P8ZNT5_THRPL|nr:uncharacterized protein LOC117646216 [Thrips palmi]
MPNRCVVFNCSSGYDSDRQYRKKNGLPQLSQFTAPKVRNKFPLNHLTSSMLADTVFLRVPEYKPDLKDAINWMPMPDKLKEMMDQMEVHCKKRRSVGLEGSLQEMLDKWEKKISRGGGWKMGPKHTVCELHFEKKFIVETHDILIDGTNLSQRREKKSLTKDAIPTVFDGYPTYMNKPLPKKRKSPQKIVSSEPKRQRPETEKR